MVSVFVVIDFCLHIYLWCNSVLMKAWSSLILLLLCRTSAPCALCLFQWPTQSHMTVGINRRLQEIGCPAWSLLFIDLFLALSFWSQFIYFSFTVFFSASLSGLCMAQLLPFLSFFHFFFLSSHSSITMIKSSDSQCIVCSCITSLVWHSQTRY